MAIIKALDDWRLECGSELHSLQLFRDDKHLQYFTARKLLNQRHALWSEFLSLFDSKLVYRPGKSNGKADALTKRPGDLAEGGMKD